VSAVPATVTPLRRPAAYNPALLEFDQEHHRYLYDGVSVPSVTQVLRELHPFAGVSPDVLEAAAERGTHVHQACWYFDEADLDEDELTPKVRGYLQGWKRFTLDADPIWSAIEKPLFHPLLRYAGTPDRFGELTIKGRHIPLAQVDIKTGLDAHPCWGVQTMAYNHAAGCPDAPRFTVQLREDGTYRLLQWEDAQDWPVFVSLTTLRTWKLRHKL